MLRSSIIFNFIASLLFLPLSSHAINWSEVYQNSKPSIPLIFSSGSICSGALIEKNVVLTAAHCVERLRPITIEFPADSKFPLESHSAVVIRMNEETDLAILRLQEASSRPTLSVDDSPRLAIGSEVATIGHPTTPQFHGSKIYTEGSTYLISAGVVSGYDQDDLISDMSISPGNSGGPVLNPFGKVVAIVSRKRVDRFVGSISYMPSQKTILSLLNDLHPNQRSAYPWTSAKSSFSLGITFSSHSYLRDKWKDKNSLAALNVDWTPWDRAHLVYINNFSESKGFALGGLGYKWQWDLESRAAIQVSALIEQVEYNIHPDGAGTENLKGTGIGMIYLYTGIPIQLHLSLFNLNRNDSNWDSQLSFSILF